MLSNAEMFYIPCDKANTRDYFKEWNGYSLLVAAVSVGNVGQLAADLIVSTLEMTSVGYIYDESILPVVGNNPYSAVSHSSCSLVTGCEVYECPEKQLVLILQRAPFVRGKRAGFRKRLVQWIKAHTFNQVIILTSSFSHERLDSQLMGSQFRFLTSLSLESTVGDLFRNKFKWKQLEKRPCFPAPSGLESGSNDQTGTIYIPGGGIAKTLFTDCCNSDLNVIVLLLFCAEGDNAWHAQYLATRLNQWLALIPVSPNADLQATGNWTIPPSWRLTFGSAFDPTLYH